MSIQEVYCDVFGNIAVTGNMIRIELASIDPTSPDQKNPRLETKQRLILPLDGFLRSFGMAQQVVNKLIEAGVVQQRPADQDAVTVTKPSGGAKH